MIGTILHNGNEISIDLDRPIDISLPITMGSNNPNCYWAKEVNFEAIRIGDFIGSVQDGGTVNHKSVFLTPHGNGTHTECFGHISADKNATINKCLKRFHFMAQLISVRPKRDKNNDDVIIFDDFKKSLKNGNYEALIIRSLLNDDSKKTRKYSGTNPPYFDPMILNYLALNNINHILVDLPSLDREDDQGKLASHKAFWGFSTNIRKTSTITELIYVPNEIADGFYFLNLQIASFELDVSPSKPVLYKIIKS